MSDTRPLPALQSAAAWDNVRVTLLRDPEDPIDPAGQCGAAQPQSDQQRLILPSGGSAWRAGFLRNNGTPVKGTWHMGKRLSQSKSVSLIVSSSYWLLICITFVR